jgi:hypothetical protein
MKSHHPDNRPPTNLGEPAAAREVFERAAEQVDVATRNRLRLMRRQALSANRARPLPWLVPAAAALLLVSLAVWPPARTARQAATSTPTPAETSETTFPMDDDAELYAWLGDAPVSIEPPGDAL